MYKVGDLVTMSSNRFLKLAKLGLILKEPRYARMMKSFVMPIKEEGFSQISYIL